MYLTDYLLTCNTIDSNITDHAKLEAIQFNYKVTKDLNYTQSDIYVIIIQSAKYRSKESMWENDFIRISSGNIEL